MEPRWLSLAREYIWLKEIKGPQHNPKIVEFWKKIKRSGIKDDETPWCAAFVGAVLETCGVQSTRFESASSYLNWGTIIQQPLLGCIVVFRREGGGHVGFVVGRDENGRLLVLGGNQGDEVNIKAFGLDRVAGYRWPVNEPMYLDKMPLASADVSRSEA